MPLYHVRGGLRAEGQALGQPVGHVTLSFTVEQDPEATGSSIRENRYEPKFRLYVVFLRNGQPAMMATEKVSDHDGDGDPLGAMKVSAGHDGNGDPQALRGIAMSRKRESGHDGDGFQPRQGAETSTGENSHKIHSGTCCLWSLWCFDFHPLRQSVSSVLF